MLLEELEVPAAEKPLFWLSFVDPDLCEDDGVPGGAGFLGVVITPSVTIGGAVLRTHHLGVNPGGEVMGAMLPREAVRSFWWDRLLTKEDAEAISAEMVEDGW